MNEILDSGKKIVTYDFTIEDIKNHFDNKGAHHFFQYISRNNDGTGKTENQIKTIMNPINDRIKKYSLQKTQYENLRGLSREDKGKLLHTIASYYLGKHKINSKKRNEKHIDDIQKNLINNLPVFLGKKDADTIKEFLKTNGSKEAKEAYKFLSGRITDKYVRVLFFYNFWKEEKILEKESDEEKENPNPHHIYESPFDIVYDDVFKKIDPNRKYIKGHEEVLIAFNKLFRRKEEKYNEIQEEREILKEIKEAELFENLMEEPVEIIEDGEVIAEPGRYHTQSSWDEIITDQNIEEDTPKRKIENTTNNRKIEKAQEPEIPYEDKYHISFEKKITLRKNSKPTNNEH